MLTLLGLVGATRAQERVIVKCVDVDGKPVAAAEVFVLQHRQGLTGAASYETSGPHTTDADGVATTCIALDYDGGCFDRWLYARVPGKSVGGLRWLRLDRSGPAHPAEPIVKLSPSREVSGRVHVPEGVDVRQVVVRTLSLSGRDDTNPFAMPLPRQSAIDGLRTALPELFDARVDGDGNFTLRDLPQRPLLYLAAEGPGLGQAQWFNAILPKQQIPARIEISMAREAVVEATVLGPERAAVAGAEVSLRLDRNPQRFGVLETFTARSDARGCVRIGGLPAAEFGVSVAHDELVMRPRELRLGAAEHAGMLMLELEPAIELRGVVRDAKTRAGIQNVTLSAITDQERNWSLGYARSNAKGEFTLRLPRGEAGVYVSYAPAGYLQPSLRTQAPLRVELPRDAKTRLEFELSPDR